VDGTDCKVKEPSPFSPKWFSHKFRGPALRYEVRLTIASGYIAWVNGKFPCGTYSDLRIFRSKMKTILGEHERVVADNGYPDRKCLRGVELPTAKLKLQSTIRAWHETLNKRLKLFKVLSKVFRHDLKLHSCRFHVVTKLTKLSLEEDGPLFSL